MQCTACGHDNPANAQFCGGCGASLSESMARGIGAASSELPMVSFIDAITLGFRNYGCIYAYGRTDRSGRATRAEFWWFALFIFLVDIIATAVDTVVLDTDSSDIGLLFGVWGLLH